MLSSCNLNCQSLKCIIIYCTGWAVLHRFSHTVHNTVCPILHVFYVNTCKKFKRGSSRLNNWVNRKMSPFDLKCQYLQSIIHDAFKFTQATKRQNCLDWFGYIIKNISWSIEDALFIPFCNGVRYVTWYPLLFFQT